MKIGIIGYEVPHRKVLEIAIGLRDNGHKVKVFGFPFKKRLKESIPIFRDRPNPIMDFDLESYLKAADIEYIKCEGWDHLEQHKFNHNAKDCDYLITCIAKIIPLEMTRKNRIINTHPGILPYNRGVDAFKRAIIKKWPIGITLHQIDENIDAGTIIKAVNVPVFKGDTLESVCERAFNIEIRMLVQSSEYMNNLQEGKSVDVGEEHKLYKTHISINEEKILRIQFEKDIECFIEHSLRTEKSETDFSI